MQSLTQPTLLLKPFCQDGDKNQIPVQNDSLVDPQLADLTNGFPEITSKPPSQGGLPPERRDFNALGYLTTSYDWFYQAGGTFTFNQTISNAIGGYPLNARLWYTDENGVSCVLRSTIANNTNNFLLDSSVIGDTGSGKPWEIENFRGISVKGFTLLETKWSDHIINDISWLRSDTFSWQSGLVYTAVYQHLVADINGKTAQTETVGSYTITYYLANDGHKIVLANQETTVQNIYDSTGIAWYYILDTTNQRFKLPRTKFGFTGLRDTVGKYVSAGLPDIHASFSSRPITATGDGAILSGTGAIRHTAKGSSTSVSAFSLSGTANADTNVFRASYDNAIYGNSTTVQPPSTQMYLYFYVGQFSQSATEQTAGLNAELFNGKADRDLQNVTSNLDFVVESYNNGTEWYKIYKSGWCEQGGSFKITATGDHKETINFLKTFANTNYQFFATGKTSSSDLNPGFIAICMVGPNCTTAKVEVKWYTSSYTTTTNDNIHWRACGYIS